MLLIVQLIFLAVSLHVDGFAPSPASSSRLSVFSTPFTSPANIHAFHASRLREATASNNDTDTKSDLSTVKVKRSTRNPLKRAVRIYKGYAKKLWRETDPSERSKIANDKVVQTVRDMQHVLTSEHETISSSSNSDNKSGEASEQLLMACENMLSALEDSEKISKKTTEASTAVASIETKSPPAKKEKKQRSILFGALMGAAVAAWVFSGNWIFTGLFCLLTILGQLEYYRMIMNTGVFPARRISVVGAASMFLTVCLSSIARGDSLTKITFYLARLFDPDLIPPLFTINARKILVLRLF